MFTRKRYGKELSIIDESFIENDIELKKLGYIMEGFSGRDIKKVVDIAYNNSIVNEVPITFTSMWDAIEEFIIGKDKGITISDAELLRIAYHEMGHAIIGKCFGYDILKIGISTKNMSLGQTFTVDETEKLLKTEWDYIGQVCKLLAGRSAEKLFIGDISAGSQNDYVRVNSILTQFLLLNFTWHSLHTTSLSYSLGYVVDDINTLTQNQRDTLMQHVIAITKELEGLVDWLLGVCYQNEMKTWSEQLFKNKVIMGQEFTFSNSLKDMIGEYGKYLIILKNQTF